MQVSGEVALSAATSAGASAAGSAISSPPDVCASHSRVRSASSASEPRKRRACSALRAVPPGTNPAATRPTTPSMSGTLAASMVTLTPLAFASRCAWPSRPNPVTSVAACARAARAAADAWSLSRVIEAMAAR